VIVFGHWPLTFEYLDLDAWLAVSVSGEGLGLLGGDRCVPWDKVGHDSTSSLNSLGKRGNVKHNHVLELFATGSLSVTQDGGLDGSTVSNSLIRVD